MIKSELNPDPLWIFLKKNPYPTLFLIGLGKTRPIKVGPSQVGYSRVGQKLPSLLIYRVNYKCIETNLNVPALNKKENGETTLIQTTAPESQIKVPRTLIWTKVIFPQDWTLQNENYSLRVQRPTQTPDLDFVQQLTDGTIKLSFDQSRFRFPLDLHQPRMQSPILLRNRPASQCSSSKPLT